MEFNKKKCEIKIKRKRSVKERLFLMGIKAVKFMSKFHYFIIEEGNDDGNMFSNHWTINKCVI